RGKLCIYLRKSVKNQRYQWLNFLSFSVFVSDYECTRLHYRLRQGFVGQENFGEVKVAAEEYNFISFSVSLGNTLI
ncbi:hypothetical protein KJ665_00245, partial [Patescibacteria group bacterium]|nr:hypothetical protein [Patescibacteria group bacterium]